MLTRIFAVRAPCLGRLGSIACLVGSMAMAAPENAYGQATHPANAAGDSALTRGDWKRLVAIYEPIVAQDSSNGVAWFRLGLGLFSQARFNDAIPAFRHAANLSVQPAASNFRIARAYARLHTTDSALAYLERAGAMGLSPAQVRREEDFATLRSDPKFVAILEKMDDERYPCRKMAEAHQLDFWIGDWVVTNWARPADPVVGENHVHPILDHCIVFEEWTSASGGFGKSFNFWDPNIKKWRQVWMDDNGSPLNYEGDYHDAAMHYAGWTLGDHGERVLQKLTFFHVASDTVRQLFEQSSDSGKTWKSTDDLRYVRKQ